MRKIQLSFFALLLSASIAAAGCADSKAYFVNEKPLPKKSDKQIDVAVQESAEGGEYEVYLGKNKKPERIVRTDYGETGRWVSTLSIGAPNDIMIAESKEIYNVPFTQPGSFTSRIETDFYYFCDGKLKAEPDADVTGGYFKAAKIAANTFFNAPEIAKHLKDSGAIPPVWK